MENQLVTVIVPVYNVEEYLQLCLDSILRQKYQNLQIVLVDDGSTDLSPNICDKYSRKDNRIQVVHKKNGGLSSARNVGLEIAQGKYVVFIDSDDFISEDYIATMIRYMNGKSNRVVCVGFKKFNEKIEDIVQPINNTVVKKLDTFQAVKYLFNHQDICNYAWNKMYPLKLFDNVRYPDGKKMEDLGTTYLLFEKCSDIVYISTPLYWYRQRANSILHSPDKKLYNDLYELAKTRYLDLSQKYGDFYENIEFMRNVIYGCYRYLNCVEKKWADAELYKLHRMSRFSIKESIKYMFFRCNKQVFYFCIQGARYHKKKIK